MAEVEAQEAELAWLIYDLIPDEEQNIYKLQRGHIVYTKFEPAMLKLTTAEAGSVEHFVEHLQSKLDERLSPPDAPTLSDITLT
jgi:hypothetical protein